MVSYFFIFFSYTIKIIMSFKTLYMSCPTLGCSNKTQCNWVHHDCGYYIEINDFAELRCRRHLTASNIFNWRFDCGTHGHNGKRCFKEPNMSVLLSVIAYAQKYSNAYNDDVWIRNLLISITRQFS